MIIIWKPAVRRCRRHIWVGSGRASEWAPKESGVSSLSSWWLGHRQKLCVFYLYWGISLASLGGHWKLVHGFLQNLEYIMWYFGMRLCKDCGDSKGNLCFAEMLTEYVGLANYLENGMIITIIHSGPNVLPCSTCKALYSLSVSVLPILQMRE